MENALKKDPYLHVGRASDLTGKNRTIYRAFEILPGVLSFGTLFGLAALSFFAPTFAAYFTILFSGYWVFKTIFLSIHLWHNFKRLRHNMEVDWTARLSNLKYQDVLHLVIFPFANEPYEVLAESISALERSRFPKEQIAVVIASEARGGAEAAATALRLLQEFKGRFADVIVTTHPSDMEGEIPGKGSNIAYAAKEAQARIVDVRGASYERTLVSAFDVDTVIYPDYFACLTWNFLTEDDPLHASFQPVPLYNNNIWNAPILSRVLAYSSTFWQMIQQEMPERLTTFSSHAVPLSALVEGGYWQKNVVSEDSRIFFNLFIHYDGNYRVVPLSYPVSMDANVSKSWLGTVGSLYKQHRRWSYGAENIAYMLFNFMHNPRIPFSKKWRLAFIQIEGFWSLATHPLILFAVGWLPLLIGGHQFNATVLSYNLPIVATWFLTLAMSGLVVSSVFFMYLVPERPHEYSWRRSVTMALQWLLVPFTMVIFSAIPGLDAQVRLFFAKYLGFWVTPKARRAASALKKT
ncbi:MAG: glycosyltransferase family 2 protein [Patescibacteria group bacterium]